MRQRLKPYPDYKDSGLAWLGGVPAHWNVKPGFSVLREKHTKNRGLVETTVLSLSYGRIIVKPQEKLHGLVPASFETYQIVDPGDIIIRPTDLQNDWTSLRVGLAQDRGIITSAYLCLKTVAQNKPEYSYLLLHTYDLMKIFYGMGSGLRQNLDFTDFKRMPVLIPPTEEQESIVRYLTYSDRNISRLIRNKQQLIKLLGEQKQAIIHRAVTCGLDRNVRLKPTRVVWLADMPMHWETIKLSYLARIRNGTTPSRMQSRYWENGIIPWLSSGKVNDYVVQHPSDFVSEQAFRECSLSLIPRGSLIMGMVGQGRTRGMTALLGIDACINQNLAAIIPGQKVNHHFLYYSLTGFYKRIREFGRGGNQAALNCEIIAAFRIPIPPMKEQRKIVQFLDEALVDLMTSEKIARREIGLINEYRTRLITDVVTGKLDVRGVELSAIDEAAELERIDIPEELEGEAQDETEEPAYADD